MSAEDFTQAIEEDNQELRTILNRYVLALFNQLAQHAACNSTHTIDERCARWLLMTHDRVGADEFPLTQEFLAQMLAVRRSSVTLTARTLQQAGLITYSRGVIQVLDRQGLEEASCHHYHQVRKEYDRLLNPKSK